MSTIDISPNPRSRPGKGRGGIGVPGELFVDTSAWYAIARLESEADRRVETELREQIRRGVKVVTTNLVIAESHALLLRRAGRDVALSFAREIRRAPTVVVNSSPEIEDRAVDNWLARFEDQPFSFTDAVSFAVMKERKIREALTLDRHFVAAGFVMAPAD